MRKTVFLKSGTECEVLAEYKDKLWLVATDGSWGPGTVKKSAVLETNPLKWVKVKKYVDDPDLSWEERYKRLEAHHTEETTFLIAECDRLRRSL